MRVLGWLLIYLAVVFIGGALAAPCLYYLAQWAANHWPVLSGLARIPFHRFVIRAALGLAVAGLWPLLKKFNMLGWREIGLSDGRLGSALCASKQIATGFAIGLASLALVAVLAVVCGNRALNLEHSEAQTLHYLLSAAVSAILVAVLEEVLFRGGLYGSLQKGAGPALAIILSSAVYSAVHFIQKAEVIGPIDWLSGLRLLPPMFRNLGDIPSLIPAFLTLFVVGVILALMYQRTGSLYTSIGLHGGWIFWLK